ncbi:MAG: hypothetical protein HKO12_08055 [Woeseiaceae bacterium]|nr:hypothetical protein [Woeseiaceae bacterium]
MPQMLLTVTILVVAFALSACQNDPQEQSAADRAISELQRKYDEVIEKPGSDAVEWATEDIENYGDWEYRVESLDVDSPEEFAATLNEFGNEKWEVIWLERTEDGYLVVLKKPSISYLSKIPLSQIGRIVIGGPENPE